MTQASPARPCRLLIVDDDVFVRSLTRRILAKKGFEILEAGDGPSAIRVAQADPGAIDLLVTDVVMPHLGGVELAAALRLSRPELRVVYMSGYRENIVAGVEAREEDIFVPKPFTSVTLFDGVTRALDGRKSA